jgi:hypothetical protein
MIDLDRMRRLRDAFYEHQVLPLKRDFEYRMERAAEADADLQAAFARQEEARRVARVMDLPDELDFHVERRRARDVIPGPIPSVSREPWGSIALLAWGAYWIGMIWAFATGRLP